MGHGSVDWGQVGYDHQYVSLCEQPDRHAVTAQQVITREGRRRVAGRVVLYSAAGADVSPTDTR